MPLDVAAVRRRIRLAVEDGEACFVFSPTWPLTSSRGPGSLPVRTVKAPCEYPALLRLFELLSASRRASTLACGPCCTLERDSAPALISRMCRGHQRMAIPSSLPSHSPQFHERPSSHRYRAGCLCPARESTHSHLLLALQASSEPFQTALRLSMTGVHRSPRCCPMAVPPSCRRSGRVRRLDIPFIHNARDRLRPRAQAGSPCFGPLAFRSAWVQKWSYVSHSSQDGGRRTTSCGSTRCTKTHQSSRPV